MSLKIEQGVQIPESAHRSNMKYPWRDMGSGDSVRVPKEKVGSARASARAWLERHKPDWKMVSRGMDDGSVRIWLVDKADLQPN